MTSVATMISGSAVSGDVNEEGQQWEGFTVKEGKRTFDSNEWTPIYNYENLQAMNNGGKYYLANDIDLTHIFYEDSFNARMGLDIDNNNNTVTVSLLLDTEPYAIHMYVLSALIFINGKSAEISSGKAVATFTLNPMPNEFTIYAIGETSNIDDTYDKNFVISAFGNEADIENASLPSKGNFKSIGSPSDPFKGAFDGNGYRIIGLRTTSYQTPDNAYSGLFAYTEEATIANIGLDGGSSIAISNSASTANAFSGGIIGYADPTTTTTKITIINSYNTGSVTAVVRSSSANAYSCAGGLIGHAGSADISYSYNSGTINATMISTQASSSSSGGLVGYTDSNLNIMASYNEGIITAYASSDSASSSAGGLSGIVHSGEAEFLNTYNAGTINAITLSNSASTFAGGIIGHTDEDASSVAIINSYNKGLMKISSQSGEYVGGMIGHAHSPGKISIVSSYALENMGTAILVGNVAGDEAKIDVYSGFRTSTEMRTIDENDGRTYVYWNTSTLWKIDASRNQGFPFLDPVGRWENFIVDKGDDYDPNSEGEVWIPISNAEDLAKIGTDNPPNDKYYLTNSIDLSHIRSTDAFDLTVEVTVNDKAVKISLKYQETLLSLSDGLISLNGDIVLISNEDEAEADFLIDQGVTELMISAGGNTITDVDGMDRIFNVASTFIINDDGSYFKVLQSKGNFEPIGSESSPFAGKFDGNGYTITGLRTSSYQTSEKACSGLFSYISEVSIRNLGIEGGINIAITSSDFMAASSAFIGYSSSQDGSIDIVNSYNSGSVIATASSPSDGAFAIVGGAVGSADRPSINVAEYYNAGNLIASSSSSGDSFAQTFIGGAVGVTYSKITVTDSYNIGNMVATARSDDFSNVYSIVGGSIGYADSRSNVTIDRFYNTGNIKSAAYTPKHMNNDSETDAGGVIGRIDTDTTILNSYNTGTITVSLRSCSEDNMKASAGGLIGYVYKEASDIEIKITNSYNKGDVKSDSNIPDVNLGGLVGYSNTKSKVTVNSSYVLSGTYTQELVGNADNNLVVDNFSGFRDSDQMKTIDSRDPTKVRTYVDWNFTTLWNMDSTNDGFPHLSPIERWENFTVDEGDSYDPTNEENDWIKISTAEDLAKIGNEVAYPLNSKYYLTNNIDLTHIRASDDFDITLEVDVSGTDVTITLKYGNIPLELSNGIISVNGQIWRASTSGTEATNIFTEVELINGKLIISAGGTVSGIISSEKDHVFAISTTIAVSGNGTYSTTLPSKGNFTPIGLSTPFTGILDGNGYTITGLRTTSHHDNGAIFSGLFAHTSGATIKNLGLEGGSSTAIVSDSSTYGAFAGGLISHAQLTTTITNSYNTGSITATTPSASRQAYSGGLIGYGVVGITIKGTISLILTRTIDNSYNTGDITATASSGDSYAGGLIGHESATVSTEDFAELTLNRTINNSYNTGDITAMASLSSYAGGFIGYERVAASRVIGSTAEANSTINSSYNTGDITATASSASAYAGGLIGSAQVGGTSTAEANSTINSSYNTGDITATASSPPLTSSLNAYAGGLIGYTQSTTTTTNSYNTGNITVTASSTAANTSAFAGGLIGHAPSTKTITITTTNSYNTGSITASSSANASAGGLIGRVSSTIIITITTTNSYNTGSITATASSSSNAFAGGLIGYATSSSVNITSSYALKDVGANYLIGNNPASIVMGNSGFRSEEDMMTLRGKNVSTFVGWDIWEIWALDQTPDLDNDNRINKGFPYLREMPNDDENRVTIKVTAGTGCSNIDIEFNGSNDKDKTSPFNGYKTDDMEITISAKDSFVISGILINGELWDVSNTDVTVTDIGENKYVISFFAEEDQYLIEVIFRSPMYSVKVEFDPDNIGSDAAPPAAGLRNIYGDFDFDISIGQGYLFDKAEVKAGGDAVIDFSSGVLSVSSVGSSSVVLITAGVSKELTISVEGEGKVKIYVDDGVVPEAEADENTPFTGSYLSTTKIELVAENVGSQYSFSHWEIPTGGNIPSGFDNLVVDPYQFTMNNDYEFIAIFSDDLKTLTLAVSGSGYILLNVGGMIHNIISSSWTHDFDSGTEVKIEAIESDSQYSFSHWEIPTGGNIPSGFDNLVVDPDQFTMNNDYEFTAIFSDDLKTLTLAVSGSGYILLNVGGVDSVIEISLPAWNHSFDSGTDISVTAVERTGEFLDWTFGTAGAPQSFDPQESAQQTFDLDEEYELTANFTAGSVTTTYTITSTSDPRSTISPEGTITVSQGGSQRFNFSAIEGYTISAVTVDGVRLSQEDMSRGYYIFFNVNMNHTIHVESVEEGIFLEITITEGYGHAEYRIGGTSYFSVYSTRVELEEGSNVTVRAYPNEGYEFVEWRYNSNAIKEQETSFNNTTSSIYLELVFKAEGPHVGPSIFDEFKEWIIALIVLILLALLLLWFLLFYRRSYEVVKIESDSKIIGKDRALRKREYHFSIEGPSALVTYSIGEEGEWKTLNPRPDGEYAIPRKEVVDKLIIKVLQSTPSLDSN